MALGWGLVWLKVFFSGGAVRKRAVIFNLKHPRADFRVAFLVVLVLIPVSFSHLLSHNVLLAALVFVVSNTGGFLGRGGEKRW